MGWGVSVEGLRKERRYQIVTQDSWRLVRRRATKLQLTHQIQPSACFRKYFCWTTATPIYLCPIYGCSPDQIAKVWQKPYGSQSLKYCLSGPLQKTFTDPWSRVELDFEAVLRATRLWSQIWRESGKHGCDSVHMGGGSGEGEFSLDIFSCSDTCIEEESWNWPGWVFRQTKRINGKNGREDEGG